MKALGRFFSLVSLLAVASSGADAASVAAPFFENFNSYTSATATAPTDFTEGGAGTRTRSYTDLGGGNTGYTFTIPGGTGNSLYAGVTTTNVVGNNFTMSADFTFDAFTATGGSSSAMNAALIFLATTTDLGNVAYRLTYTPSGLSNGGRLNLTENGTTADFNVIPGMGSHTGTAGISSVNSGGSAFSAVTGVVYTLSIVGTYNSGTLSLTGTMSNGSTTLLTVGATDSSPRSGTNMGVRIATNNANNSETVTWDNINITAVPEPTVLGLFATGSILLLGRRKVR
jgi:hypothetical protein